MSKILIENGIVVTVDPQEQIFSPGFVYLENDRISSLGPGDAPAELREGATEVIDADQMAVMPGMVNCHTHLFQSFIRGLADDKPLLEWLKTCIWPVAKNMTGDDAYHAAMVGFLENIRCGATSVIDHQYIHTEPANDDGVCRAAEETGERFLLSYAWADMDYHPILQQTQEMIIRETTRLYETWQNCADGRIRMEFGPLIPWGCSDETMLKTYELARKWGVGTQIHVAETREEVQMNLEKRGNRHIEWLADLGILGPDVQLVHSVWLEDNELDLVADSGSVIVHCPVSNMYLASGTARIPEMLKKGITVSLATDGPGSNNNQDMMELLKITALLHKVNSLDAMAMLPEDVIKMACRGGSQAFGQPQWIGSLELGKKADVVLVDLNTPFTVPVHKVISSLVYCAGAGAVDTVIVDGKVLMKDKEILCVDEEKVLSEARNICSKLFERAGVPVE